MSSLVLKKKVQSRTLTISLLDVHLYISFLPSFTVLHFILYPWPNLHISNLSLRYIILLTTVKTTNHYRRFGVVKGKKKTEGTNPFDYSFNSRGRKPYRTCREPSGAGSEWRVSTIFCSARGKRREISVKTWTYSRIYKFSRNLPKPHFFFFCVLLFCSLLNFYTVVFN